MLKESKEKALKEDQAAPQRVGSPSDKKQGTKREGGGTFYIQKRRGGKPRSTATHQADRGVGREAKFRPSQRAVAANLRRNQNLRRNDAPGEGVNKVVGGHKAPDKQNEARKEAWLNAFESILLEFDPRHEKRETSKRPGARRAQISGSLAAGYAKDQEERKSDRDLSSKEEIKLRAKKAANRARNRVGGTTGQQADPVLNNPDERAEERENPEPKNPQERANTVRRARQQRDKKGK